MKGFEKIIKHPWFKRAMYTLAIINLYGYATKKKFNCLLSFVAAVMVTHYFIRKSIPLALLVGLFISSFVLGCGKILEGNTSGSLMTEAQAGNIADALKLNKGGRGYAFAGNYGTKGLYAYRIGGYRGLSFFGRGGTPAQQQSELYGSKYRPVKAVQDAGELLSLTPDVTGDTFCGENTSWVENKCKAEGSTFCGKNTSWVQNKCIVAEDCLRREKEDTSGEVGRVTSFAIQTKAKRLTQEERPGGGEVGMQTGTLDHTRYL